MANTLENFSLYLWKNPEGYHVTVTTNYNLQSEKRSFFSFGKQTYRSWRAFNLHQPEPLKGYFAHIKETYQQQLKTINNPYWISKLGVNTGSHGRRTAPGVMILQEDQGIYNFVVHLVDYTFEDTFDSSLLTANQRKGAKGQCLGAYIWKNDDTISEYAEAF